MLSGVPKLVLAMIYLAIGAVMGVLYVVLADAPYPVFLALTATGCGILMMAIASWGLPTRWIPDTNRGDFVYGMSFFALMASPVLLNWLSWLLELFHLNPYANILYDARFWPMFVTIGALFLCGLWQHWRELKNGEKGAAQVIQFPH